MRFIDRGRGFSQELDGLIAFYPQFGVKSNMPRNILQKGGEAFDLIIGEFKSILIHY